MRESMTPSRRSYSCKNTFISIFTHEPLRLHDVTLAKSSFPASISHITNSIHYRFRSRIAAADRTIPM